MLMILAAFIAYLLLSGKFEVYKALATTPSEVSVTVK